MKKILIMAVSLIPAYISIASLQAQSVINLSFVDKTDSSFVDKIKTATESNEISAAINTKAIKNFNKNYKNATNAQWMIISDGYTAEFLDDGNNNVIYYDKKGNWAGYMKTFLPGKLPADLKNLINRDYHCFTIDIAHEIETIASNGIPTYVVTVEDNDSIKWLRIYEGVIEEYKNFLKR